MVRRATVFATAAVATSILSGCVAPAHRATTSRPAAPVALVPRPVHLETLAAAGGYELTRSTRILAHPTAKDAATYLHDTLSRDNGMDLPIAVSTQSDTPESTILLTTAGADPSLPPDGYTLDVRPDAIVIRSATPAGFFYGVQTLRQLLLADNAPVPTLHIADHPRYPYRGFMLDCSRHFMDVAFVKRTLDLMAYHKFNVFH